jgi:hypothetical protein
MAVQTEAPRRPGAKQGAVTEFTLVFNVKPGHGQQIREFLGRKEVQAQRDENIARLGTLHDARWVLFDDDTRLLFATNFDGDWDAYIDDFAAMIPEIFDGVLQHTEDYPGIHDPNIKDQIVAHQHTAVSYIRAIPDATVKDLQKALRVNKAFQQLLDEAS